MRGRWASFGVAALLAVSLQLGCVPDPEDEVLVLRLTGGCSERAPGRNGELAFLYVLAGNTLDPFWLLPDRPGVRLPQRGVFLRQDSRIEDGEFLLFGPSCTSLEGCPAGAPFARCAARRAGWQLELTCLDGAAQPLCSARLDEVGVPGPRSDQHPGERRPRTY